MSTRFSRLIGSLTVGRKLALIYFLDLTTVLFISGILINEKYIAINFTKKEMIGNQFIAVVRDALLDVVARNAKTAPEAAISGAPAAAIRLAEERFGAALVHFRVDGNSSPTPARLCCHFLIANGVWACCGQHAV